LSPDTGLPYWNDATNIGNPGTGGKPQYGVAEIPLSLSVNLPTTPTEGAGEFTVNIDLTAGTFNSYDLAFGAQVWYVVSGITQEDLENGYSLTGRGTIDANGNIVLDGATTSGIKFALKDDGIAETEDFEITFYTDDPTTTTETLSDVQLGTMESASIVDTGIPFNIGDAKSDLSDILISGISGAGISRVESISITRVNVNPDKGKPIWEEQKTYSLLNEFPDVDGITFTGGDSANTISGAGDGDTRLAFDGQLIIKGELGSDSITGGTYRNLLQGGGIAAPGTDATGLVDTLTGTTGAIDVFDLRTGDNQNDAYAAINSGYAVINNFVVGEDFILMANDGYTINRLETTTGKGRRKVTTYSFEIRSGGELVATIASPDFTSTSTSADLGLTVSKEDPSSVLFGGQDLFF
jgi:hypothetical protein